jgi:hypothetical protein
MPHDAALCSPAARGTTANAPRRLGLGAAIACAALLASVPCAHALPAPDIGLAIGHTFAILGVPNAGGFSGRLSAVWPVETHFDFGGELSADDFGSQVGQIVDAGGNERGSVQQAQRSTFGAAWRMDANLPQVRHATPYATGTWGVYRIADSQLGVPLSHVGTTGFTLGGGLRWPVTSGHAVGVHVRYARLFNDVAGRFMSAGVDWTWRAGGEAEDARGTGSAR